MKRMIENCWNCSGMGHTTKWKAVVEDESTGTGTMQREDTVCESCGGKGYKEYAVFSIEEAQVILKHCGLTAKS